MEASISLNFEEILDILLSELDTIVEVRNTTSSCWEALDTIIQLQSTLSISKIPEIQPFDEEKQIQISRALSALIPTRTDVQNVMDKPPSEFDFFISLQKITNCLEELKLLQQKYPDMYNVVFQVVQFGMSKLFSELQKFVFQLFEYSGIEDLATTLQHNHIYATGTFSSHKQMSLVVDVSYEQLRQFQNFYFLNKQFVQKLKFIESNSSALLRTKFFEPYIHIMKGYYQLQYDEKLRRLDSSITLGEDETRNFYSEILSMRPGKQFQLPEQSDLNKCPMQQIIQITQQSGNSYGFLTDLNRLFSFYEIAPFEVETWRLQENYYLNREKFIKLLESCTVEELYQMINIEVNEEVKELFKKSFNKKLPDFVRNCEILSGSINDVSIEMEILHIIMHLFLDINYESFTFERILGNGEDAFEYSEQLFQIHISHIIQHVSMYIGKVALPEIILILDFIKYLESLIIGDEKFVEKFLEQIFQIITSVYVQKHEKLKILFAKNEMHQQLIDSAIARSLQHVAVVPSFTTLEVGYIMENNFEYFPQLNFELILQFFEHLDSESEYLDSFYREVFYVNNFYIVCQVLEDFIIVEDEENIGGYKWCQKTMESHLETHLSVIGTFRSKPEWKLLEVEPYLILFSDLRKEVFKSK